jgi:sec-independent protein translocase protein TatA
MELYMAVLYWHEILLIVLVALILFGPTRIPELMRGLGRGVREFKEGIKGGQAGQDQQEGGQKRPPFTPQE